MDKAGYRLLALGVLIVASAGVFGWLQADTRARLGAVRGGEAPTAAAPPPSTTAADLAVLAQRRPWGQTATEAPAAPAGVQAEAPTGTWRVAGIMGAGADRHVILLVQPQSNARHILRYLPVGDHLPDGRIIERITGDSVHLRRGDQVSVLRLFSPTGPG